MDGEEEQIYLEQLMDNYKNPRNVGKLEDYTFFKRKKNPSCGDLFEIYVKLDEKKKKIVDVKFQGDGCAISTASMSLFTEMLKGMEFEKAKKLTDKDVYSMLGIRISPGRVNCAMLSINAFMEGVDDFNKSNG